MVDIFKQKSNTTLEEALAHGRALLQRARDYEARRRGLIPREGERNRPMDMGAAPAEKPGATVEVITPSQLMDRLQVKKSWITEKRRRGCVHPLPALMNKPLRFNWYAILIWLAEEAQVDKDRFQRPRPPVRPYHRKRARS